MTIAGQTRVPAVVYRKECNMLSILEDYIWRSLPEWGAFSTNPNLTKKVNHAGEFLPFHGNTVVFDLSGDTKLALQGLQEELYQSAGWMLAQKLDPSTFHMTLHDLVNGPELTEELKAAMAEAEEKAKHILNQWKGQPPLHMKATWLFNMVNTSIVLGLIPADEDSWRRLEEMYLTLESVVPLGYALTPHITMAYFKPGTYCQYDLDFLRKALRPIELEVPLGLNALFYQEFADMNHYRTK